MTDAGQEQVDAEDNDKSNDDKQPNNCKRNAEDSCMAGDYKHCGHSLPAVGPIAKHHERWLR